MAKMQVEQVLCSKGGTTQSGTLHLTTHHLIFGYENPDEEEMWVSFDFCNLSDQLLIP